jgi:hypothetical protein
LTAPYQPKPTIVDRVLSRLFPTAAYQGLLNPEEQRGLQRQGLLQLGTNLLQAGGASPYNRGTLANLGASLQGVDIPGMAEQALRLQAVRQQRATQQAVSDVAARHPPKPNETPAETYGRIAGMVSDLAGQPGTEDLLGKLSNVLAQLRPPATPARRLIRSIELDERGLPRVVMVDPETGETVATRGRAYEPAIEKPATPQERVAGSQLSSATDSVQRMRDIATRNPSAVREAIGFIKAESLGGLAGRAAVALRGSLTDPDANDFYSEYHNWLLSVTPTYGGSRPTDVLLRLEQGASLPGATATNFDAAFRTMQKRLEDLRAKAGRAAGSPAAPAPPGSARPYRSTNPFAPRPP